MITDQEFRQGISEYIRRISPAGSTLLGQVKSVDASEFTCTIQDDDPDSPVYEGVRLRPILDGNESMTIFPTVGTWVLAIRIEEDEDWMVMAVGQADRYRIVCGNTTVDISASGVVFNGGSLGGLVKLSALVEKLNMIENDLKSLKMAFNSWVTVPNDGGAALKAASATWAGSTITTTQQGDLENTKIQQ